MSGYQVLDDEVDDGVDEADADTNLLQGYYDAGASYQGSDMNPSQPTKRKTKKKKKVKKVSKSTKNTITDPDQQQQQQQQPRSTSPLPSPSPNTRPRLQPQLSPRPSSSPLPPRTISSTSIFRPAPRKTKAQLNAALMPNSASVSFVVRGWLPSGIKVDSLNIDPRRSRGLGEGVKPYKGVKYLCVSRRGVETRC